MIFGYPEYAGLEKSTGPAGSNVRFIVTTPLLPSGRITGKPEVNCRKQAITQACAFPSPFFVSMSEMGIYRQLIPSERDQLRRLH
jgi:hypothetical protein